MFLNRHSIPQEKPSYRGHHERLPFARYPGMLHDIMRLHIVFVMVLPLQHHIIDKLFVNNKDLTPLCLYSSGVKAEIVHWKLLAKTNHEKRAAFIHFDEDVNSLLQYYHGNTFERAEEKKREIKDKLIEIISQNSNISQRNAGFVIEYIEKGKPSEMLDSAPVPPRQIEEINIIFSKYSKRAERSWLLEKLTGHDLGIEEIPEVQIAVWVLKNMDAFKSKKSEIANFLKNGAKPSDSSLQHL